MILRKAITGFEFLPVLLLISSFIFVVWITSSFPLPFYLDESVVTMIAQSKNSDVMEIVTAEPHPPGFYLLLKLFPLTEAKQTRLLLTLLSYCIYAGAMVFAYRNTIYKKYNLHLWFGYIVSSALFPLLVSHVRHDIITFPLTVLYSSILVAVIDEKGTIKKHVFYLTGLLMIMLFLAYVPFLYMLGSLWFAAFFLVRRDHVLYAAFIPSICSLLLFLFYTKTQLLINIHRFVWVGAYENSMLSGIKNQMIGKSWSNSIITDSLLIGFFVIVVYSCKVIFRHIPFRRKKLFITAGILLIATTYIQHGFVTERYGVALYLYILFIVAYGMSFRQQLGKYISQFMMVLFLLSLSGFCYRYIQSYYYFNDLKYTIENVSEEKVTGLLFEDPIAPFLYKQQFLKDNDNVVPVSAYYPNYFVGKTRIEKNDLIIGFDPDWQKKYDKLIGEDIKALFSKNNLDRYVYVYEFWATIQPHYDKNRIILKTLNESCDLHELYDKKSMDVIVYYFSDCIWE